MRQAVCTRVGALVVALWIGTAGATTFREIAHGEFVMGSPSGELGRQPNEDQHGVTLTRGFHIQSTEVTNQQYMEMAQWAYDQGYVTVSSNALRDNLDTSTQILKTLGPSEDIRFDNGIFSCVNPTCPVTAVSWYGAAAYCDWVSMKHGVLRAYNHANWLCNFGSPYAALGYRLPTEAEWEYACRAQSTTAFASGEISVFGSVCTPLDPHLDVIGWYCGNAGSRTHPTSQKAYNEWQLYDMHGNAWEWVNDWYGEYGGAVTDPTGGAPSTHRIIRGGSWHDGAQGCRSAVRNIMPPGERLGYVGFRPVRSSTAFLFLNEGQSGIQPSVLFPGETCSVSYRITNNNVGVQIGLGCSIRPVGASEWIDDPSHDVAVTLRANSTTTVTRSFQVPAGAPPGIYEVWYALRDLTYTDYYAQFVRNDLTIASAVPANIVLLSPNGRENIAIGSNWSILWSAEGVDAVNIELVHPDSTRTAIATNVPNTGYYDWSLSSIPSPGNHYRVRVCAANDENVFDQSAKHFRINEPAPQGNAEFVQAVGSQLVLHGEPYTYVGANAYALLYKQWYHEDAQVDELLDRAVNGGIRVLRMWVHGEGEDGSNPPKPYIQSSPGEFDDSWLCAMDTVVAKCNARGIKIIATLGDFWPAYGGLPVYVDWYNAQYDPDIAPGSEHLFYQDPQMQAWYREFVRYVINRYNEVTGLSYKNDPTIMAWELMNEPRVLGHGASIAPSRAQVDDFLNWVDRTAQFIKLEDGGLHLVGIGGEGSYAAGLWIPGVTVNTMSAEYYSELHASASIDFCTQHLYPDACRMDLMALQEVENFVSERVYWSNTLCGKPLLLEEFGMPQSCECNGWGPGSCGDYQFAVGPFYDRIYESMYFGEGQGTHFWNLATDADAVYDREGLGVYASSREILDVVEAWSETVSGISAPPAAFTVVMGDHGGNYLSWSSAQKQYSHYRIYRDIAPDFTPGAGNLLHETMGTSYLDPTGTAGHYYCLTCADASGAESDPISPSNLTDVTRPALPQALRIYPCQPNPFNPKTTIRYDLPDAGAVRLEVFDLAGRLVRTLTDERSPQGSYEAVWDGRDSTGRDVGSGTYLGRLKFGGRVETVRMGLVR